MSADLFLAKKTAELCREHFPDKKITNLLVVKWGKAWKSKLGHIKPIGNEQFGSLIELNSVLQDPRVPEFVIEATLLHELVHYFQGFGSNHPKKQRHPHRGRIIEKEFEKIGWTELSKKQDLWIKKNFAKLFFEKTQKENSKRAIDKKTLFF